MSKSKEKGVRNQPKSPVKKIVGNEKIEEEKEELNRRKGNTTDS